MVEIERGSAIVGGQIVWVAEGRAGIKLTSKIDVESWLPRSSRGQSRIDEIVYGLKRGQEATPNSATEDVPFAGSSASDLCEVAAELESVARSLALDEQCLANFAEDLQRIDIAAQRLRRLAEKSPLRT
ncbi:MAG TPA: hypothetical protein VFK50_08445 [Sphingomicrobium sp.]|nr:hypothetical protein [Sphingomicrobium sp.]